MRDHAFVHSCFAILSSFVLRISSFTQVHRSLADLPGTRRDPSGTERDTFWTLKGRL